jgi:hypothetical protein
MALLRVKEADLHTTSPAAAAAPAQGRPVSPSRLGQQQQQQQRLGVDEHGIPIKDDRVLQALQRLAAQAKALQSGRGPANPEAAAAAAADGGAGGPSGGGSMGVGLVVDGGALALLLQPQHEDAFLDLAKSCDAVICCRVSPMQKAQVSCCDVLCRAAAGRVFVYSCLLPGSHHMQIWWSRAAQHTLKKLFPVA